MKQEIMKEIKPVDHGEDAINGSPKFKEFRTLIADSANQVEQEELDATLASRAINLSEFATLSSELSKRTKLQLKEAEGKLKRYGLLKEERKTPRLPGEKGHIEISEDGTLRAF